MAGGRPDPAFATGPLPKAFAPLGGRTMVEWVLAALRAAAPIARIALVGPDPLPAGVAAQVDLTVRECGDLLENVAVGLAALGGEDAARDGGDPVLIAAADIPLVIPSAIERFLDGAAALPGDVWYSAVPTEDVARVFPGMHKTSVRLRDGTFAGGSLVMLRPRSFARVRPVLEQAVAARKQPWKLARLFGPGTLLALAAGRLRIAELEEQVAHLSGVRVRAVVCRDPEIAIDVDKPETLGEIRRRLAERQAAQPQRGGVGVP